MVLAIVLFFLGCSRAESYDEYGSIGRETSSVEAINVNTANRHDLLRIPHVGERLAQEIIEHREMHGPFRKPEHLMLLNGISDTRFREIRHLIRVD
jgi:competence ComEA-like helix-hairpin-helix protein